MVRAFFQEHGPQLEYIMHNHDVIRDAHGMTVVEILPL